jgi:hypothetical protein
MRRGTTPDRTPRHIQINLWRLDSHCHLPAMPRGARSAGQREMMLKDYAPAFRSELIPLPCPRPYCAAPAAAPLGAGFPTSRCWKFSIALNSRK